MRPPIHIVLHLARIAWLATEYGLIASLLISAVITIATSLGRFCGKLVNKTRCRSRSDAASPQLILS